MSPTRRLILAAAGAGFALPPIIEAAHAAPELPAEATANDTAAELARLSAKANAALMRGEIDEYRALVPHADDYTLMSPFGGTPTRGEELTEARWKSVGRFFRNGTFSHQVVESYATADMVALAVIERCNVEVGGLPAQEWLLRVTLVYRRERDGWRLAHRHADPLANGIGLEQAAALGRGEAA
ncbi:MAG TPA: nuclear transport factor 2 family protein [Bauldia sp.]|nr:nuclear transport factor 2 family protein [Bauldia sp.]